MTLDQYVSENPPPSPRNHAAYSVWRFNVWDDFRSANATYREIDDAASRYYARAERGGK